MICKIPKVTTKIVRKGMVLSYSRSIHSVKDVVEFMGDIYEGADREMIYVLCQGVKGNVLSIEMAAMGTLDTCMVTAREIFKTALLSNAYGVIIVHNHPSEDPEPSEEDRKITQQFVRAGNFLNVQVIDHVIYGRKNRYFSFKEEGLLERYLEDDRRRIGNEENIDEKDEP